MSDLRLEHSPTRCPYCHEGLGGSKPQGLAACASCGARHHRECFDGHGSCSSCGGQHALVSPPGKEGIAEWLAERLPPGSALTLTREGEAWVLSWPTTPCLLRTRLILLVPALLGLLALLLPFGAARVVGLLTALPALICSLFFFGVHRPSSLRIEADQLVLERPGLKGFGGGRDVGTREHGWSLSDDGTILARGRAGQFSEVWLRRTGLAGAYLPGEDFDAVQQLIEAWRADRLLLAEPAAAPSERAPELDAEGAPLLRRGPLKA